MKKLTSIIASVVALSFVGAYFLSLTPAPKAEAGFISIPTMTVATTTATTAITTSVRILATTTNPIFPDNSYTRAHVSICNPNANPVFLNLDGDKDANFSTGHVTTVIAAAAGYNVCYEITDRNPYSGSITASSTNQTSTRISIKEYVY